MGIPALNTQFNWSAAYNLTLFKDGKLEVCYDRKFTRNENLWRLANPLVNSLPYYVVQLCLIIVVINIVTIILKPLRQPRLIPYIISGFLLGATIWNIEANRPLSLLIMPFETTLVLETMANLGLLYYMFLVGLEMDLKPIRYIGANGLCISLAGIVIPLVTGMIIHSCIDPIESDKRSTSKFFWGVSMTVTSFPDIARILSDMKLMQTDLGRTALTCAIVNDVVSWGLLITAITFDNPNKRMLALSIGMVPFFWFILRPIVVYIIKHSACTTGSEAAQGRYNAKHVHVVMGAVPLFGLLTDAFGAHSIFGAFLFGLIIPNGELGMKIMEMLEEYVIGIMLPPFFLTTGIRANINLIFQNASKRITVAVIVLTSITKILATAFSSLFFGFNVWDGVALGFLMNTKGVLALIVLNSGRDVKGFDATNFMIMLIALFLMTFMVVPFISLAYKPTQRFKKIIRRTLEKSKHGAELRLITCVHSQRHVSGMVNLLQLVNPTSKLPVSVFAMHLVELTERNAAMLIVQDALKSDSSRQSEYGDQIMSAFENFEERNGAGIQIQNIAVVSAYANMHKDVLNFAGDKGVNLILVPFHKQPVTDGRMEEENPSIREMNTHLLTSSWCSVGIFVDRGLNLVNLGTFSVSHGDQRMKIAMLYVGGSDDREALAFACRMSGSPGVSLTVVRFMPGRDALDITPDENDLDNNGPGILTIMAKMEKQRQLDDAYINEFRFRSMNNGSISFINKIVNSGDEIFKVINKSYVDFDLYVVGRGRDTPMSLTLGLSEWSEYPELGSIGDMLVQSEIMALSSVLVIQQQADASAAAGTAAAEQESDSPKGTLQAGESPKTNAQPKFQNEVPRYAPFVNHRRMDDEDDYVYAH